MFSSYSTSGSTSREFLVYVSQDTEEKKKGLAVNPIHTFGFQADLKCHTHVPSLPQGLRVWGICSKTKARALPLAEAQHTLEPVHRSKPPLISSLLPKCLLEKKKKSQLNYEPEIKKVPQGWELNRDFIKPFGVQQSRLY